MEIRCDYDRCDRCDHMETRLLIVVCKWSEFSIELSACLPDWGTCLGPLLFTERHKLSTKHLISISGYTQFWAIPVHSTPVTTCGSFSSSTVLYILASGPSAFWSLCGFYYSFSCGLCKLHFTCLTCTAESPSIFLEKSWRGRFWEDGRVICSQGNLGYVPQRKKNKKKVTCHGKQKRPFTRFIQFVMFHVIAIDGQKITIQIKTRLSFHGLLIANHGSRLFSKSRPTSIKLSHFTFNAKHLNGIHGLRKYPELTAVPLRLSV